jgi:hypothetical protein
VHIEPVFVDASGRRRRVVRRAGLALGVALAVFVVLLVVGVATGSGVPLTPWSAPSDNRPQQRMVPGGGPALLPKGGGTAGRGGSLGPSAGPSGTAPAHAPLPGSTTSTPSGQNPVSQVSQGPTTPATTTPATSPAAVPTTTHPGNSQANPPAWGKKKKPAP